MPLKCTGSRDPGLTYLGPAPAQLARVRGVRRHHLLLKAKTAGRLSDALRALDDAFHQQRRFSSVQLVLDVNPRRLLQRRA